MGLTILCQEAKSFKPRNKSRLRRTQRDLLRYAAEPIKYAQEVLQIDWWAGRLGHNGQLEIAEAIAESVRRQLAGDSEAIRIFRVEAGHGVGKTYLSGGLVNWFFDAFQPSIIYTTAPSGDQVRLLLWKDIKSLRPDGLPGEVLTVEMRKADNHFAIGRATGNANDQGTERFQGQHGPYLMFVVDEAEGVDDYVYDAINAMTTGGTVVIVLLIGNPRTRTSRFARMGLRSNVSNFRLSCIYHPNCVEGREVVPGAVNRRWVDEMVADHCDEVKEHSDEEHTFELPWRPGEMFRPDSEFLFRVMGIAPKNTADDTMVSLGRYEAARDRDAPLQAEDPTRATLGVDAARWGSDVGTLYCRHRGRVWREKRFPQQDTIAYAAAIHDLARRLFEDGVTKLHIRVDGGGGFGGGVIDQIKNHVDFLAWFDEFLVYEVQFGGVPQDIKAYANCVTELYAFGNEALKSVKLIKPASELEQDLTARRYNWTLRGAYQVKQLEKKEDFKKAVGRSPDDGDGFVLAVAPDFLFTRPVGTGFSFGGVRR